MKLRPYQTEASESIFTSLRAGNNPVVQLPTGTGKSLVIADVASKLRAKGGNTFVVTHVKELVVQNKRTLDRYAGLEKVGTMCAGLNENSPGESITFGTIQSLYRPAMDGRLPFPHAIIIDEAHRVPPGDDGKLYYNLIKAFPSARRIGMSATPWRMDGGSIYKGDDAWFDDLCYQKTPLEMVELGYLCPLVGVSTEVQLDLQGISKTGGDYTQSQVDSRSTDEWLALVAQSVKQLSNKRKHVAVYCPTINAATRFTAALKNVGIEAGAVHSESEERNEIIEKWEAGEIKALCSVDILTTGFDFPALDCIVCLRPTQSTALWVQILGRGTRIYEGKEDCLVLDYVGNLTRLGGINMMEDFLQEKNGQVVGQFKAVGVAAKKKKLKISRGIAAVDPMQGSAKDVRVFVNEIKYVVIGSKKQPGKTLLMAVYDCETEEGYPISASQFLCVEYSGWARTQAEKWFKLRGVDAPYNSDAARRLCYGLPIPREADIRRNGKYVNVVAEYL